MAALRVRYQTIEFGDEDIHVRSLRDTQEFSDDEHEAEALGISSAMWPLFGIVWPSGLALARHMHHYDTVDKRILEVGCGIGLASLLLNHLDADITATDCHPEAGNFLARNAALNGDEPIPFVRAHWEDDTTTLEGKFDLIIGSDLLYERGQAEVLAEFVDRYGLPTCEVVILDPRRGQGGRLRRALEERGYTYEERELPAGEPTHAPYTGQLLTFTRRG